MLVCNTCTYKSYAHDIQSFSLSLSPLALTCDNVLKELEEISWLTLCNGEYYARGVLQLPPSQRQRIERMHASEKERKDAGVMYWVDHHPYASWRLLIRRLDMEGKHSLANWIHQYAEKVSGMLSSILYCH